MTYELAFLEQIALHPDDLGARLRYADYLEQSLDPALALRAEFIRVQNALDALHEHHPSYRSLLARERQLLDENWHIWFRPICEALAEPLPLPAFRRSWTDRLRGRYRNTTMRSQFLELTWESTIPRDHQIAWRRPGEAARTRFLRSAQFEHGFVQTIELYARTSRGPSHLDRLLERAPITSLKLIDFHELLFRRIVKAIEQKRLQQFEAHATGLDSLAQYQRAGGSQHLTTIEIDGNEPIERLLAAFRAIRPNRLQKLIFQNTTLTFADVSRLVDLPTMPPSIHALINGMAVSSSNFARRSP